jgi:hypothetical protein
MEAGARQDLYQVTVRRKTRRIWFYNKEKDILIIDLLCVEDGWLQCCKPDRICRS